MICNNCQKENDSAANFCNFCGDKLLSDYSKKNQEETSDSKEGQSDKGWQIEKEQTLEGNVDKDKQKSVSDITHNQNTKSGTKSKRKKRQGDISIEDSHSELVGEVRGFKTRNETSKGCLFIFTGIKVEQEIWNFRLERYFDGQQLPPIPIEMRGQKFKGFINEGDTVQLLTDWKDGLHKTKKVFNVTNNMLVKSK